MDDDPKIASKVFEAANVLKSIAANAWTPTGGSPARAADGSASAAAATMTLRRVNSCMRSYFLTPMPSRAARA